MDKHTACTQTENPPPKTATDRKLANYLKLVCTYQTNLSMDESKKKKQQQHDNFQQHT